MNEIENSVITLSSDDEDQLPRKKPKLSVCLNDKNDELVILSDDENNDDKDATKQQSNEKEEHSKSTENHMTNNGDSKCLVGNVEVSFDAFLDLCTTKIENAKHKELLLTKIGVIKRLYKRTTDYVTTDEFKESLKHQIHLLHEQPKYTLHCFNIIFQQLKQAWKSQDDEIDESNSKLAKKVEKKLNLLHEKIRQLENAELTLDDLDDEDSTYIQLQRYKERAKQLYEKYCELINEDAHSDRIVYKKLRFNRSKYQCINKAIRKRYKNNDLFPTYYDIDMLIRKCVEKKKLELSNIELEMEIKQCFEALGNLLQKRRKQDLLDIHVDFITCTEDPAETDKMLQTKLKVNKKEGEEKLNKICSEFVIKQENGEDCTEEEEEEEEEELKHNISEESSESDN